MRTHEQQMAAAGLIDFSVLSPVISDEGLAAVPPKHYDAFINAAPIVLMEARKPAR